MNIIKQIIDENGNNIYPIGYAQGGMKMDLLWTNPSPTSAFGAQTISLDLSEYASVVVVFNRDNASSPFIYSSFALIGDGNSIESFWEDAIYSSPVSRHFSVTASGVSFELGTLTNKTNLASHSTSDIVMIPLKIYGVKLSYIVPTSVHGLQYVEV